MKFINLLILILLFSCNSGKNEVNTIVKNKHIENAIIDLVNYRKENLAIIIYEDDVKKMKDRYKVSDHNELLDVSKSKLVYDKCILISLRENKNDFEFKDVLGGIILEKWKKKNYLEKYHFESYNHNPSLSLMKMFDFYNSKDLKKYSDSLFNETLRRYKSGQYPDLEDCLNNPEMYLK
ncbi:MAG: hypothetical protein KGZ81_10660 [Flavobacteriales bacterium]|nr:hypothetical protein [Flavobacteriales bacterium]